MFKFITADGEFDLAKRRPDRGIQQLAGGLKDQQQRACQVQRGQQMNHVHLSQIQELAERCFDRRNTFRDEIEMLRQRVHLLAGRDRIVMRMYLEKNSFGQIGQLIGVDPANVSRRIHKVTEKLIAGEYIECLRLRDRFTQHELAIAREHFLLGKSIRQIAVRQNESYYEVQQTVLKIRNEITREK